MPINKNIKLRDRIFSNKEIAIINNLSNKYYDKGITFISKEVCVQLNWKQPNGWLKDRACREALRRLEGLKLIKLPPAKKNKKKNTIKSKMKFLIKRGKKYSARINKDFLTGIDFSSINIRQVKGTNEEDFWNWIVNKYHYLGFKLFVGRSLKYIIYSHDKVIAAIGFCDPVWSITPRDSIFKNYSKEEIRILGINNGRFLILPWIKVPNLASHLLSQSLKEFIKIGQIIIVLNLILSKPLLTQENLKAHVTGLQIGNIWVILKDIENQVKYI